MEFILSQLTWWHWMALALVLFGIEMMTGTFDLLMVSIAAVFAGLFAALAPEGMTGWQAQMAVFAVAAVGMVATGRVVFAGRRKSPASHPALNDRMAQLIGQRGEAVRDFHAGQGQVRIGDTVWGAEAADPSVAIKAGDLLQVEATRANLAIVKRA